MSNINDLYSNNSPKSESHEKDDYSGFIEGVRAASIANNLSCIIIDFDEHKTIFMSDNLLYLNEVSHNDFVRNSEIPYWSLVSEDTLETLLQIHHDYSNLRLSMSKEEYSRHVCTMDYPINIRGRQFYINSRFVPLKLRPDGITQLGLFTCAPSNRKEMSFLVITTSGKRWIYDFKKRKFSQFDLDIKLSLVEKAILQRARKGMTNEEIAEDLFLSTHTIKSHRLRIFKKLNVKTISEALLVVGNYLLI